MNRLKILSLLPILTLASCNGVNPYGTYQFRLGKTDGNHIEVTAILSKDDHPVGDGMKKMQLNADLGDSLSPTALIDDLGNQYPILEPFIEIMSKEIGNIDGIPMYFKVLPIKSNDGFGHRLAVGTDFVSSYISQIEEKYPDIKDFIDSLGIPSEALYVKPEYTQYVFGAYINERQLTFQIPVSIEDLNMQMLWYGISNRISDPDYVSKLPGPQGEKRIGSHPQVTKDKAGNIISRESDLVNKMFENEFSNTYLYKDNEPIGNFVTEVEDDVTTLKLYLRDTYTGPKNNIEGVVYTKSLLGDYDEAKNIKLSVDDNHITNVTHNGKGGKEEGFTDENGTEFLFSYLMQEPFAFRDYHVVNVGLIKK